MKLQLNDVIRVKEDLQFHYTTFDKIVGEVYKVTTIINDHSVLVQKCTINGAVTHSDTKRVRNPDMDYWEFTDYYDTLKTDDPDKLACERGESIPVGASMISDEKLKELMAKIEPPTTPEPMSGGVWWEQYRENPFPDQYPFPAPETDPEIFAVDEEEVGEIKSDGGSSRYYDIPLPDWLIASILERNESGEGAYIKTQELIEVVFDNDFDFGCNFKASVRAAGKMKGAGKAGNTLEYECNKMHYYVDRIEERGKRED